MFCEAFNTLVCVFVTQRSGEVVFVTMEVDQGGFETQGSEHAAFALTLLEFHLLC